MPICKNCGVEIEATAQFCPLCGMQQGAEKKNKIEKEQSIEIDNKISNPPSHWFLELFTFFSLAGLIIIFAVDFAYGTNLTWSRIPLISLLFAWIFVFLIFSLRKKPYLLVTLEMLDFIIFLWLLDHILPHYSWFFTLALPVILVVGILFLLVILWIRSFQLPMFISLSVGTLAVGIFLLCLEFILNRFHDLDILISWSLVAFACILLVCGLFLNLQKKIDKNGWDWKKYFHV